LPPPHTFVRPQHLEALVCDEEQEPEAVVLPLLLAAARAMGPLIRRFIGLGLNRVWLNSGDVAYQQVGRGGLFKRIGY